MPHAARHLGRAADKIERGLLDVASATIDADAPQQERNPAMGRKGVRGLLAKQDVLRLQLRAILREHGGGDAAGLGDAAVRELDRDALVVVVDTAAGGKAGVKAGSTGSSGTTGSAGSVGGSTSNAAEGGGGDDGSVSAPEASAGVRLCAPSGARDIVEMVCTQGYDVDVGSMALRWERRTAIASEPRTGVWWVGKKSK